MKSGWLVWVEQGKLARKTYLFEQSKPEQTKKRLKGQWIPVASPYQRCIGINGVMYPGPQRKVMQYV